VLCVDVCLDICHQVLDLYSKTQPHKDMEALVSSAARAQAAVASADDSQARLTPKTPQTPKSVGFVSLVLFVITHTHSFNGPFSGTTRVSRYQKGKTNLDFTEARDSE